MEDGTTVTDHVAKESILFEAFKERLGKANPKPMRFNLSKLLRSQVDFDSLTTPFSHAEIDAVIKDMPPDRAPGPDGFNGLFLKKCWHIISADFIRLVHESHAGTIQLDNLNDA